MIHRPPTIDFKRCSALTKCAGELYDHAQAAKETTFWIQEYQVLGGGQYRRSLWEGGRYVASLVML